MLRHVAEVVWDETEKYKQPSNQQQLSTRYSDIQQVYELLRGFPHVIPTMEARVQFVDVLLCSEVEVNKKHLLVFLLADVITKRMPHVLSETVMKNKQQGYHGRLFKTTKRLVVEDSDGDSDGDGGVDGSMVQIAV